MDAVRQIRLTVAPFLLVGSLLLGAVLSGAADVARLNTLSTEVLVAIGGAVVGSALPLGFVIGGVTVLTLRFAFWLFGRTYEVVLPGEAWERVGGLLGMKIAASDRLYAGVTFDHELMKDGIHQWLARRWSAFNSSAHCCTALILAPLIGTLMGIPWTREWLTFTTVLFVLLTVGALNAWRETMGMLDFQSRRPAAGVEITTQQPPVVAAPAAPTPVHRSTDLESMPRGVQESLSIYQGTVAIIAVLLGFTFAGLLQLLLRPAPLAPSACRATAALTGAMVLLFGGLLANHVVAHQVHCRYGLFFPRSGAVRLLGTFMLVGIAMMFVSLAPLLLEHGLVAAATIAVIGPIAVLVTASSYMRHLPSRGDYVTRLGISAIRIATHDLDDEGKPRSAIGRALRGLGSAARRILD